MAWQGDFLFTDNLNEMKNNTNMVDCPVCFNSSGFTLFTGSFNQTCKECNGKMVITATRYKRVKSVFKDLIR